MADQQNNYQVEYTNFIKDHHIIPLSSDTIQHSNKQHLLREEDVYPNKAARIRITFTNSQREALEKEFKISPYLFKARRIEIAKRLDLEEKNVKVWFQNRRMKSKKEIIPNGNKITKPYKVNHVQQVSKSVIYNKVLVSNTSTTPMSLPKQNPGMIQLIKGPPNVPTTFKSHVIVQAPVTIGNVPQIKSQQILFAAPQSKTVQIPFQPQFPRSITQNGQVFQPPFRLQPITIRSVSQQHLVQQRPVTLHQQTPQLIPTQQPAKNVELKIEVPMLENINSSGSVEKPIEFKISVDMSAAVDQNPEDSINLDAYLNDLTNRVNAHKKACPDPPRQQELPATKTKADDLDFSYFYNNLEQFIDPQQKDASTLIDDAEDLMDTLPVDASITTSKMEEDGFDMEDFMANLDQYATHAGLPEKSVFDTIFGQDLNPTLDTDIHSLNPTLDIPSPMENLSFADLDSHFLLNDSLVPQF